MVRLIIRLSGKQAAFVSGRRFRMTPEKLLAFQDGVSGAGGRYRFGRAAGEVFCLDRCTGGGR